MPAESLALLLRPFCPFGRYRHGFDPPGQLTRFSFLPCAFACEHFPLDRPSSFFTLSLLSQQLNVLEPFLNPFRPTIGQLKSLESVSKKFAKKEEQMTPKLGERVEKRTRMVQIDIYGETMNMKIL